ncbi:transcription factor ces-2 isoform X2 [Episyrphus balteatus]|uniref:transcription factor ces-2 isoform X2 n=1 Tax=Episyrphus balteatus TaxID=286459 RepID=UPI002484EFEB|nr:transcription factor ces-2 isoform X2 [Episyrphus balteatus]
MSSKIEGLDFRKDSDEVTDVQNYYSIMKDTNNFSHNSPLKSPSISIDKELQPQPPDIFNQNIGSMFPQKLTENDKLPIALQPVLNIVSSTGSCSSQEYDYGPTTDYPLTELNRSGVFSSFLQRRPRGEKRPIPDEQKDEKYYERRKRNNEAAKKSRDARKIREDRIAFRAALLEQENSILRAQIAALRNELHSVREMFSNGPASRQS